MNTEAKAKIATRRRIDTENQSFSNQRNRMTHFRTSYIPQHIRQQNTIIIINMTRHPIRSGRDLYCVVLFIIYLKFHNCVFPVSEDRFNSLLALIKFTSECLEPQLILCLWIVPTNQSVTDQDVDLCERVLVTSEPLINKVFCMRSESIQTVQVRHSL